MGGSIGVKHNTNEKKNDEQAVLYIKYEIDDAWAEKIKEASAASKQVIFSFDPSKGNIILVFKMDDESKNLTVIAPLDKNIEEVEEIVKNREKYLVLVDTLKTEAKGKNKNELEIIVVNKDVSKDFGSQRRRNYDDYLDMYA